MYPAPPYGHAGGGYPDFSSPQGQGVATAASTAAKSFDQWAHFVQGRSVQQPPPQQHRR